jgi:hypothetical protein
LVTKATKDQTYAVPASFSLVVRAVMNIPESAAT